LKEEISEGRLPLTPQAMLTLAFEDFMIRCVLKIMTTLSDDVVLLDDLNSDSGGDSDSGISDDDAEGSGVNTSDDKKADDEGSPMHVVNDDDGSPMHVIYDDDDDKKEDMSDSICKAILKHIEIDVEMEVAAKGPQHRIFQVRLTAIFPVSVLMYCCCTCVLCLHLCTIIVCVFYGFTLTVAVCY
jgi:hypothetical protein